MKNIINIVSAQTLPNYLFVREKYEKGDKIIWIVTHKVQKALSCLKSTLSNIDVANQKEILLEEDGEENISYMTNLLKEEISPNEQYCVNLTGGTKLMAMIVYNFFKNNCDHSSFYYMPIGKNTIIDIEKISILRITYTIKVKEYLQLYDLKSRGDGGVYFTFKEAEYLYEKYSKDGVYNSSAIIKLRGNSEELNTLAEIRSMPERERKREINRIEEYKKSLEPTIIDQLQDKDIASLIKSHSLPTKSYNKISKHDAKYLTGGWFEEFIYFIIKRTKQPDDILHGIQINKIGSTRSPNEIDVIYTKDNKLYVIECKSGIPRGKFNSIVDKIVAIKSLLGKDATSYLYLYMNEVADNQNTITQRQEKLERHKIECVCKPQINNMYKDVLNKLN